MKVRASLRMMTGVGLVSCCGLICAVDQPSISQCVECHTKITPNIVSDWKLSKHSQAEITCIACHGASHVLGRGSPAATGVRELPHGL